MKTYNAISRSHVDFLDVFTTLAPSVSQTITAGQSVYICGPYEIVTATSLEIGSGACMEIG